MNEANSYHDFIQALFRASPGEREVTAWLVADHRAIRAYGLGFVKPRPLPLAPHLASGYLKRGRTVAAARRRLRGGRGGPRAHDRRIQPPRENGFGPGVRQGRHRL
ncbi:MAG: hypothetical protein RML56_10710 [Burkholderiales bacterium]|nr:hypothetical protein [Burkholderiales bacterium]